MKKLLSIVLTITILASMLSVPMVVGAKTYTTINLSDGFVADSSFSNAGLTEVAEYGVGGKDANDESAKLTETSNIQTSWYQYDHGEEIYFENGQPMTGYLVVELNLFTNANNFRYFFFGLSTNQARMSEEVDMTKYGLKKGQWNHIRMVYWANNDNCDFQDYTNNIPTATNHKLGASDTYLNGVQIGSTKQLVSATNANGTAFDAPIDQILLEVYSGDRAAQHSVYYDDIKIYKSATHPGSPSNAAIAATGEYTVSDTTISLASGASLTPAEISTANSGYTITAFSDSTCSTQLANDAVLGIGNAVVAKSPDGVYTYYSVVDNHIKMIYEEKDGNFEKTSKLEQTAVKGVAGKAESDESSLFTAQEIHDGNMMISLDGTYTRSKNYLVMEANINPVAGEGNAYMSSVAACTQKGATVATGVSLPFGQWNKYLMYVDYDANKAYVYVNGQLQGTPNIPDSRIYDSKTTLRMTFSPAGGPRTVFSVYVDDMKWYETNTQPDGAAKTALPVPAASQYYSVADGNKVKANPTTTVANIKAANQAGSVRVYKDSTMKTIAEDSALAITGMVVVVEDANNALKAYPVVVEYGEKELELRTGDGTYTFPDVSNGNGTGTTVNGCKGKDASNKVLAVTPANSTSDTYVGLKSWGSTKAGSDKNGTGATWDKLDYRGYLVIEFSIFNVDCNTIAIVTDRSNAVTDNFSSSISKNQWSRVKVVVDATNGVKGGTAYAYVDGKLTSTTGTKHNLGVVHPTNFYYMNAIRLRIKEGTQTSYVDDIRVYEVPVLRPEESIDFVAPGVSTATDYTFGYVDGATVTVGDIKAANPNLDIKFFNNKTNYTEITSNSAVLAEGNVIFVDKQSQSAKDANINYKDLFRVMTVEKKSATNELITATPSSGERVNISPVTGGVFGNKSSTIKKVTNNGEVNNWYFQYNHKGLSEGMKYLVWQADFAPAENTTKIYLGANQNTHMSDDAAVGNLLNANQWHKIVAVYDIAADLCDLYVNGKLVSEDYKGCYNKKSEANNGTVALRTIVEGSGAVEFESYIDNYKIYESIIYPEIAAPATLAEGYNQSVSGFVNNTSMIVTAKNGTSANITAAGYDISVMTSSYAPVSGTVAKDNIILAQRDGNFAYYKVNILADNDIVILGDTYDANEGIMRPGTINAYGITENGGAVVVAQYDEHNNLIKVKSSDVAVNGMVSVEFTSDDIEDAFVKVYLFSDFEKITPLCKNKEIEHTRNYNILFLGNSFSMDVSCYMEEIAAAAGKKFNIAVLNKGGSAVSYHYENREVPADQTKIMFWLNDVSQTYANLKTVLEKYEWDYVVLQNWGDNKAFYTNNDANYNTNWKSAVNLAEYVHEKEPNAEIMIHETWSFEAGYNDFTDVATRDKIGADIRELYDRVAREAAAAIGQSTPLRKISSLDAFEAAREYETEAGLKLFETTYYKEGHMFTGYENRAEVPVGDGSGLLSPDDLAAGKVSLHRDGFHAAQTGRYLIALNAVQFLTGKSVYGNTYRPGEIVLDSSAYYGGDEVTDLDNASSGVINQKYDPLTENIVGILQTIAEGIRK